MNKGKIAVLIVCFIVFSYVFFFTVGVVGTNYKQLDKIINTVDSVAPTGEYAYPIACPKCMLIYPIHGFGATLIIVAIIIGLLWHLFIAAIIGMMPVGVIYSVYYYICQRNSVEVVNNSDESYNEMDPEIDDEFSEDTLPDL